MEGTGSSEQSVLTNGTTGVAAHLSGWHLSVHNPKLQTKIPTPCSLEAVRSALFRVHRT